MMMIAKGRIEGNQKVEKKKKNQKPKKTRSINLSQRNIARIKTSIKGVKGGHIHHTLHLHLQDPKFENEKILKKNQKLLSTETPEPS